MATNSEQSYEDWLEREDFDRDFEDMDAEDIQQAIDEIWGKQGRDTTSVQSGALAEAIEAQQSGNLAEVLTKQESYYRHMGGKFYPRLASRGIKRVTYLRAGVRLTRYSVPGSRGLYSLGSARQIFESL